MEYPPPTVLTKEVIHYTSPSKSMFSAAAHPLSSAALLSCYQLLSVSVFIFAGQKIIPYSAYFPWFS
jgi:hypothetical protein